MATAECTVLAVNQAFVLEARDYYGWVEALS